ncbi:hypothetical protein [Streptomyces sp. NPDC050856]|uniref:hypothetical protein n=1 Tax=Streptomyces sp. NPDC050856 TaxID=3154939 RepID=UPI0033EC02A3
MGVLRVAAVLAMGGGLMLAHAGPDDTDAVTGPGAVAHGTTAETGGPAAGRRDTGAAGTRPVEEGAAGPPVAGRH